MFYEKIKALCDKQGISITELTVKLKIGTSAATGWKNGSTPRAATLKAIADFFGIDVSYFNDGVNTVVGSSHFVQGNQNTVTFSNGESHTRALSDIEIELLRVCEGLEFEQKTKILTFAYDFQKKNRVEQQKIRREFDESIQRENLELCKNAKDKIRIVFKLSDALDDESERAIGFAGEGDELKVKFESDTNKYSLYYNSYLLGYIPENYNQKINCVKIRAIVENVKRNGDILVSLLLFED